MANETMGLLGRKMGMTQLFTEDGTVVPVTVLETGPCTVLQVKTTESKDGYNALQLGFGIRREKSATKAEVGHAAAAQAKPAQFTSEIRVDHATATGHTRGQIVTTAIFQAGERIDIEGTSKGRGFQGVFKRHHFAGFERSHGTHEYFRHGGSVGTRLTPGMTLKGKRMPGHLGNHAVTVQNMQIFRIDAERNLVYVRGGVPGPNGAFVTIRHAVKHSD